MFSSVTPYEFWSIQEDLATKYVHYMNIFNISFAWVNYKHYPIITWTKNTFKGKLTQIDIFNIIRHKWWIHINLLVQSFLFLPAKLWLTPQEPSLNFNFFTKDDWLLIDIQQAGKYLLRN